MGLQTCLKDAAPFVVMLLVECGEISCSTIIKAAMNSGMSNLAFIVYYNVLGTLLFLLFFLCHRYSKRGPPLTFYLLCRFFLLGFLGLRLVPIFGYMGINYSSPTLAAALSNLTPPFVFVLAIIFRMEYMDIRSSSARAKSLGTVLGVFGALVVTLYKGPTFLLDTSLSNVHQRRLLLQPSNWVLGGLLLSVTYVISAVWTILQTATVKEYPDMVTIVFFSSFFGTIQRAVFALIVERDSAAWTFHLGIEITATVCGAIYTMVFRIIAITWCLHERGPLFVALFKPLGMVVAVIMGVAFLGDILHLGSVIGATTIAVGFYTVMWGLAKEKEIIPYSIRGVESSSQGTPLLQNQDTPYI